MDLIANYDSSTDQEPELLKRLNAPIINLAPETDISQLVLHKQETEKKALDKIYNQP